MSRRHKISRRNSKRNFMNHAVPKTINYAPALTRGGFRL